MLRFGQEYRPYSMVKTGDGTLQPQLLFKKQWPWVLVVAALIGGLIAVRVMQSSRLGKKTHLAQQVLSQRWAL